MPCKFVKEKGFTGFQCSRVGMFDYLSNGIGKERLEPYFEDECRHDERYEYKGQLICKKCGAVYNERYLIWEEPLQ
jgi:hypothetical protein